MSLGEFLEWFVVCCVLFIGFLVLYCLVYFSGFLASYLGLCGVYWWLGLVALFFLLTSIVSLPVIVVNRE